MAIIGTVAAVAAVGTTATGIYESSQAAKANQSFQQQQVDRNNALVDQQNARSQEQIAIQGNIVNDEQQADDVRRQAMAVDANRKSLEVLRNGQQAYALSLSTATAQGANGPGSSGLAGGLAQVSGDARNQLLGISQSLQSGNSIFDINKDITQQRIALGKAGYIEGQHGLVNTSAGDAALGAGLTSLGGTVLSAIPTFGKLAQSFGTQTGSTNYYPGYSSPESTSYNGSYIY